MEKKEIIKLKGDLSASSERQEAFVTEFQENDGFINEECYDLIQVLDEYDGKTVNIKIEISR